MNHKIILAVCIILLLSTSFLEGSGKNFEISPTVLTKNFSATEQEKIEIIVKRNEKEEENFSVGDRAIIMFKANNSPLKNVSVRIIKYDINKTISNTTVDEGKAIILDEEGIYEIFAEKENFKPAKKTIVVRRNFDVNITVEEEKDRVMIKVLDALTKEGISGAVITIEYEIRENKTIKEIRQREKTDIDGELRFKIPPDKYSFCIEKENYNKFCQEVESMKALKVKLSENYISENRYEVFSNLTLTTFYAYKDVQVIVDEIFVKTEKGNFSIYPRYAQSHIFLNETGRYEIYVKRKGYNDAIINIFVEKADIDVYLSISKNLLIINSSKQINEIKIKCNANNKQIELWNVIYEEIKINDITEKNCELILPEQYNAKFYVNNRYVPTNQTDKFKFRIKKVYDYTWLYTAIIIIVLLSTLVIVQQRYKRK